MPRKKLAKSKLENFRAAFIQKRQDLIASIRKLDNEEIDSDGDDVDVVQSILISEQASLLSKRDVDALNRVETALERIDSGTFGICEECNGAIGEKRLLASPGCTLCITCQEEEEKASRQYI